MAYEFTRKTDNVDDVMAVDVNELQAAIEDISAASGGEYICQGRLTLQSGVPVSTSDQIDKTTLYFTPYNGDKIDLYDGSNWVRYTFAELSYDISALTGSRPRDIFIYDNAGTPTLSGTAWTDNTNRAVALTTLNGVYVKSSATKHRYLGTIYVTADKTCSDSESTRFVWNYYHQKLRKLVAIDTTDNWTYTAGWRAANDNTTDGVGRFSFVLGMAHPVSAYVQWIFQNTNENVLAGNGIGLDRTNGPSQDLRVMGRSQRANIKHSGIAKYNAYVAAGLHYLQRLEVSAATGTTTWYGDNGNPGIYLSGMVGEIMA